MKFIFIFFIACAALAQPDIASIVDNDPFDPDRGRKEVVEEQVMEEAAPPPADLPVLDGTMVIGKKKFALFSYMEEGKRRYQSVSINEVVAGYKVTQIRDREVKLMGGGTPVSLRLFNGEKTKRGGSKKAAKKAAPKKPKRKPTTKKNQKEGDTSIISPNSKKENDKEKSKKRFVPRKPQKKNQTNSKDQKKQNKKFKNRF